MPRDDDVFLGKYSSAGFTEFYDLYESFINDFENTPSRAKKNLARNDESEEYYLEMAVLFNSHKEKSSRNVLYRKNKRANDSIINLWLHKVRNKVKLIESASINNFSGLTDEEAREILSCNVNTKSYLELPARLLKLGVILIYERTIPSLNLDGVVYKNTNGNPIIALSIRHNRLDNFWFTLSHELSHIILHYEKLDELIVDDLDEDMDESDIESEANRLASDLLIPRRLWRSSSVKSSPYSKDVKDYAKEINTHPSIVAGRIRRDKNDFTILNDIIFSEDLIKELF